MLDTLERFVQIEWVEEGAPSPVTNAAGPQGERVRPDEALPPLPDEVLAELMQLARLGHPQGLQQALQRCTVSHPRWRTRWVTYMAWMDAFEIDRVQQDLERQMTESNECNEDPLDEPQS